MEQVRTHPHVERERLTVRLEERVVTALRVHAAVERRAMSSIVTEALERHFRASEPATT